MNDNINEKFMREAIKEAKKALAADEVPVGCVIVCEGRVISRAYNKREKLQNATAHAEMLCIQKACKKLKAFRLNCCEMYVTLEPCPMCAGAIINARLNKLYFGAYDPKGGACGTLYNITEDKRLNHRAKTEGGLLKEECAELLKNFFGGKRKVLKESSKSFDE